MILIAKADGDLIFQMTEGEAAIIAGFTGTYDSGWEDVTKVKVYGGKRLPIGTSINVVAAHIWISDLKSREKGATLLAETLREIAGQISINLPTVVLLPETKA